MYKLFAFALFFMVYTSNVYAQSFSWELKETYKQKNIDTWDITPTEEVVVSSGRTLYKLGSNFEVLFTQSNSAFGNITEVDAQHSLKMLVFSENQQTIGIVDNTLSFQKGLIDLSSLDVGYATHACYSDQSERFWVYDEQNTRLLRFQGFKSSIKQVEVTNLVSITRESVPSLITENQNQLIIFYEGNGVFIFDYYGSLLKRIEDKEAIQVLPSGDYIYFLHADKLIRIHRKTGEEMQIDLPYTGILDLRIFENHIYFKDKAGIKKYSFISND